MQRIKIVYLPLDSRPCNRLFPVQLCHHAGHRCILPDEMDYFRLPSRPEAIRDFLMRTLPGADAAVVSVDQLAYGSLLASREMDCREDEAVERVRVLEKLHTLAPGVPVHAFNILLRDTVSALSKEHLGVYYDMWRYSEWTDRASLSGRREDRDEAARMVGRIPLRVLHTFMSIRQRNHLINRLCVDMAGRGIFSSLMLLMEDAKPEGIHRREQRTLQEKMRGMENTFLHNGADEGGCMAVMRAIRPGKGPGIQIRYLGGLDGHFTSKYENLTFEENLRSILDFQDIGVQEEADIVLAVAGPAGGIQGECLDRDPTPPLPGMAAEVDALIQDGKRVYLLDVINANGGSMELMHALKHPEKLWGYSAWNTTSNALGTLVAQIVSDEMAGRMNVTFRNERFLDDLLYQGKLRRILMQQVEKEGDDAYALRHPEHTQELLKKLVDGEDSRFLELCGGKDRCLFLLPWPRTFEVQARVLDGPVF
ncbi:MAG: DUF4127 family protein [Clostridia bacterium]|nr:DUF4127 family protein [Clostridia bacterium]